MRINFDPDSEQESRVSIPVPFLRQAVGAGQILHNLFDRFGISQCGDCGQREQRLNRLLNFRPMRGVTVRWDD